MSLLEIFFQKIEGKWEECFLKEKKNVVKSLNLVEKNMENYTKFYPKKEECFDFLTHLKLENVKVIIWGGSPYTKFIGSNPRAKGYAFGVDYSDTYTNSQKKLIEEMEDNFNFNFMKGDEFKTFEYLIEQGVLFINKIPLSSVENKEIFKGIWNRFIYILVSIINENIENCLHVTLGNESEKLTKNITSRDILSFPDPVNFRFKGCKMFIKINILLDKREKQQINWNPSIDDEGTYVNKKE
jgi:uracil DNA glycosylase